jgi:alanyl-tRNA synthetase
LQKYGKNKFVGYTTTENRTKIVALLDENFNEVDELQPNSSGWVMLEETPFYATSGGQVGDVGAIEDSSHIAIITDTKKFFDINISHIKVETKNLTKGEIVDAVVVNREEVAKHHSATHLLQSALKMVLGESVAQAGSLNDAKRLRFDFTYPKALTSKELNEIQDLVNSMIAHSIGCKIEQLPIEEAKKTGAIAMFGEKYGDIVRVVKFDDVSIEFCGGTHVKNSSEIGSFYIVKESGVSAGVRRIEAVCGLSAISYAKSFITKYNHLQHEVKNSDVLAGINKLKSQIKELKQELQAVQSMVETPIQEQIINNTKLVVDIVKNGDLKQIVDDLKNQNNSIAIFLLQIKGDKVLIVSGAKNTTIKAGDWIKAIAPIVQGGGGGRADFAQAGGKDTSKIDIAKDEAIKYAQNILKG